MLETTAFETEEEESTNPQEEPEREPEREPGAGAGEEGKKPLELPRNRAVRRRELALQRKEINSFLKRKAKTARKLAGYAENVAGPTTPVNIQTASRRALKARIIELTAEMEACRQAAAQVKHQSLSELERNLVGK